MPLYLIHYAQSRLGIEAFGFAQFGISAIEIATPLIVFGYNNYGIIEIGRAGGDREKIRSIISNTMALKMIHAATVFVLLLGAGTCIQSYNKYLVLIASLSFSLFFTSIETLWVHIGIQRVVYISIFNTVSKMTSFIFIIIAVNNPSDSIMYAALVLAANAMVSFMTAIYCLRRFPLTCPSWSKMREIFNQSKKYALLVLFLMIFERIDLLVVEHFYGTAGVGVYSGPLRINHSFFQILSPVILAFFSETVIVKDKHLLTQHVRLASWVLLVILVPVCIGSFFTGADILELIFNEKYRSVALVLNLLFIGTLGSVAINIFGFQVLLVRDEIWKLILSLVIGLGLSLVAALASGPQWGLPAIAASVVFGKAITSFMTALFSKPHLNSYPWKEAIKVLAPGMIMMAFLKFYPASSLFGMIFRGGIIYTLFLLIINFDELKKTFLAIKSIRSGI